MSLKRSRLGVEFYDPEQVCAAAPVRDNLLFGRVSYRVANAQARVAEAISAAVRELGLLEDIERVGLDRQVGHGRAPAHRAGTRQRQSGALPREASRHSGDRRRLGALRRGTGAEDDQASHRAWSRTKPVHGPAERPAGPGLRYSDALRRRKDYDREVMPGADEATEPRSPDAQRMAGEVA